MVHGPKIKERKKKAKHDCNPIGSTVSPVFYKYFRLREKQKKNLILIKIQFHQMADDDFGIFP